jgi:hypothetical protein
LYARDIILKDILELGFLKISFEEPFLYKIQAKDTFPGLHITIVIIHAHITGFL